MAGRGWAWLGVAGRGWALKCRCPIDSRFCSSCFDEYVFTPLPDCVAGGFPIPFQVYYATKDKRVKEHHVVEWKKFTSEKCDVYAAEGNHLFFFDVPQRATFMTTVLGRLPAEFK